MEPQLEVSFIVIHWMGWFTAFAEIMLCPSLCQALGLRGESDSRTPWLTRGYLLLSTASPLSHSSLV